MILDPVAALVVIDLQNGIASMHPMKDVIDRSAQLAKAFREKGLPIVLVNVSGGPPGRTDLKRPAFTPPPDFIELVPELDPQASDILITKQRPGAFLGTDLDAILRQRGVTQIILTGVATSNGVEATARSAYDLGYNVVFVLDAMTDRDAESHRHSVETIFPRIGETTTTAELLADLSGDGLHL